MRLVASVFGVSAELGSRCGAGFICAARCVRAGFGRAGRVVESQLHGVSPELGRKASCFMSSNHVRGRAKVSAGGQVEVALAHFPGSGADSVIALADEDAEESSTGDGPRRAGATVGFWPVKY